MEGSSAVEPTFGLRNIVTVQPIENLAAGEEGAVGR
jgi:hypothetical protein